MLCFIQKFTMKHGQVDNENFSAEFESWKNSLVFKWYLLSWLEKLPRLINCGVRSGITQFWVAQSLEIDTRELMKRLRFDNFSTRRKRRQTHKFCVISDTWKNFVKNHKKCFVPSFHLITNEQLFPFKRRCSLYSTCRISPIKLV